MVDILTHLHQYVPMIGSLSVVQVPTTNNYEKSVTETLHHLLISPGPQSAKERREKGKGERV